MTNTYLRRVFELWKRDKAVTTRRDKIRAECGARSAERKMFVCGEGRGEAWARGRAVFTERF